MPQRPEFHPLAEPFDSDVDGIPVRVTHRAIGYTFLPWQDPPLQAVWAYGFFDVRGRFRPVPRHDDIQRVAADEPEYAALMAAAGGKVAGTFRTSDVLRAHADRKARTRDLVPPPPPLP